MSSEKRGLPEQAAKQLAGLVLDSSLLAIFSVDRKSCVNFANDTAVNLFGYTANELQGGPIHELIHYAQPDGTSNPFESCAVRRALREGVETFLEGEVFFKRDGTPIPSICLAAPLIENGEIRGGLLMIRDVRNRWREPHIRTERMAAAERLAGGVAHDFNNLLTCIATRSSMLAHKLHDSDMEVDATEIVEAARQAEKLTRQLLAFSRKQIVDVADIDIDRFVADACPMLEQLVGDEITLEVALNCPGLTVAMDPTQLEQCLINLTLNAREALPDGGEVMIATEAKLAEEATPADAALRAGTYVVITISDTGVGMSESARERIFEPFFTTKPRDRSSGMGLATVHGIVRQAGGWIDVDSAPGAGTRIVLSLPTSSAW